MPHGGNLVVLSYGFWKRKFGGDPGIVGRTLSLSGEPYTILGVTNQDFVTDPEADVWLPFQFPPNSTDQAHYFTAAGRLKPGVSLEQAKAQMKLAYGEFKRLYPDADPKSGFSVKPLKDAIVGDMRKSLLVLIGAVSFVLLIACANVANLLMVRAAGRKREFAIRAAMGARRTRMIVQLLTESILLALVGGALGLGLGFAGVRWLLSISPGGIPRIGEDGAGVTIDWRVALFTIAVSIVTGILFGLMPAFGASRPDLAATMNEGGSRSGFGLRQSKARSLLIVSEVGLALVLLVGAALLIRTFIALHRVQPGFDAHNVITMEMALNGPRYEKTAGVGAAYPREPRPYPRHSRRRRGRRQQHAASRWRVWSAIHRCRPPAQRRPVSRRRRMEGHLARVLRRAAHSHRPRPRLHRERRGRRSARGPDQRGLCQKELEKGRRSGRPATDDRKGSGSRIRRARPDHHRDRCACE